MSRYLSSAGCSSSFDWRECKRDFKEHDTEQNRFLWAQWNPLTDVWTFRGPGAGGEPEKLFKSLANKAARGLPHSQGIPEGWKTWLDTLRKESRNVEEHLVEVILSSGEWDKFASPTTKGVVESVTITDKIADSIRQLGFPGEPGTEAQRKFEGISGVIRDLFATSANYCLELEGRAADPQSLETLPDKRVSAQALKTPPAPAAQQPRSGKRVRSDPLIERVKQEIRKLREAGFTQQQICERLGKAPRPRNAAWQDLTWREAFRHPQYKPAVKSWMSRV